MSFQVTEAFAQQFADNFMHVAQQQRSRFEPHVTVEPGIRGTSRSINRLGQRTAQRRLSRHSDTPLNDQPHSTRFIDLFDWEDGDAIDDQDKVRMLVDPQSDYVRAMVAALNRAKDDVVISAALGAARSTTGNVAFPAVQRILAGGAGLTRAKVVQVRGRFRRNEADAEAGETLYMCYSSQQLENLLNDTTLTNTERNTVVSMISGTFVGGTLFGFIPIPSERLPLVGTTRTIFAWAKTGIALGFGENITVRVAEDPGKSYSVRPYARMSLGAVRVEEEKVVAIECLES